MVDSWRHDLQPHQDGAMLQDERRVLAIFWPRPSAFSHIAPWFSGTRSQETSNILGISQLYLVTDGLFAAIGPGFSAQPSSHHNLLTFPNVLPKSYRTISSATSIF